MNQKFYIKGNVPSSKNSKVFTGKFLVNSKTVQKYLKTYGEQWKDEEMIKKFKLDIKEFPIKLHMFFIRDSKRKFDYINAAQLPCDLMVKYDWIPDDSMEYITPIFDGYEVNKDDSGLIFWVE